MTTKDNLTYSQLKVRLHSLSSNVGNTERTSALVANHRPNKHKKRRFGNECSNTQSNEDRTSRSTANSPLSCTWCKARNFRHEGHIWQECRKLKASKSTPDSKSTSTASAHITTDTAVSPVVSVPSTVVSAHITEHADVLMADVDVSNSYQWKFDTGSSAHMTDQIAQFTYLTPHHGIVRVGGNSELLSEGIGTVLLSTRTAATTVRLNNVLYVPTLGHSLLSWNQIKNRCHLIAHGSKMTISTISDNTPIFDIEFRGSLPYVVLSTSIPTSNASNSPHIAHNTALSVNAQNPLNSASSKAHFWHAALGHSSRISPSAYADGHILSQAIPIRVSNRVRYITLGRRYVRVEVT